MEVRFVHKDCNQSTASAMKHKFAKEGNLVPPYHFFISTKGLTTRLKDISDVAPGAPILVLVDVYKRRLSQKQERACKYLKSLLSYRKG